MFTTILQKTIEQHGFPLSTTARESLALCPNYCFALDSVSVVLPMQSFICMYPWANSSGPSFITKTTLGNYCPDNQFSSRFDCPSMCTVDSDLPSTAGNCSGIIFEDKANRSGGDQWMQHIFWILPIVLQLLVQQRNFNVELVLLSNCHPLLHHVFR